MKANKSKKAGQDAARCRQGQGYMQHAGEVGKAWLPEGCLISARIGLDAASTGHVVVMLSKSARSVVNTTIHHPHANSV
jgi:hypothetical protein